MAAVSAEDWMLHTPGGGPLDSRCPCMTPELCPRMFGESQLDIRLFGQIPICMDSRQVRCCGASFRVEKSRVPDQVTHTKYKRQEQNGMKMATSKEVNNTQQIGQIKSLQVSQEHANSSSQTTLDIKTPNGTSVGDQQPRGGLDLEYSNKSFNTTVQINYYNLSPKENMRHATSQQSEDIRSQEEIHKDSNSDSIIVFPWRETGELDSTEQENIFIVYPSNNENITGAWNSSTKGDGSLTMAEIGLFESEKEKNNYSIETPSTTSRIEQLFDETADIPEKEYLVASGSEYKGVRTRNEMQEDLEDDLEDDNEEDDVDDEDDENEDFIDHNGRDDDDDDDDEEGEDNGHQVESPIYEEHTLTDDIQSKRPNFPKRTFVSENLKMRISQLATGAPRRNPATSETGSQTRHFTGPRTGQTSHSIRGVSGQTEKRLAPRRGTMHLPVTQRKRGPAPMPEKTRTPSRNSRPEANKNSSDPPADRMTERPQPFQRLRSNVKTSTRVAQDRTTTSRTSQYQDTLRQLEANHTHGTAQNPGGFQGNRHRQGPNKYQIKEDMNEMASLRHRQVHLKRNSEVMPERSNDAVQREGHRILNTDLFSTENNPTVDSGGNSTGTEDNQSAASDQSGVTEPGGRPLLFRRKATEVSQRTDVGTFGARTRTRDRPLPFQTRPTHPEIKAEADTDLGVTNLADNHQRDQGLTKIRPLESGGVATRAGIATVTSLGMHGELPMAGTGLINVVGPIPKGFTDPVTVQNIDTADQRRPLFHLPYPIQPEPFRAQITNPLVPTQATPAKSAKSPTPGVTSFNQDTNVFHQPHTQTFGHHQTHSPQTHAQITTPIFPNRANVNQYQWKIHGQEQFISDQQPNFIHSHTKSSLTAPMFNFPATRNPVDFSESPLFHLPHLYNPEQFQIITTAPASVAPLRSAPDDETISTKTVPLPHPSSSHKFLSFSDHQLKQRGNQKENSAPTVSANFSQNAHDSSVRSQLPPETHSQPSVEKRPDPLPFVLSQRDAADHAAQLEYTKKLQDYYQQFQSYYREQH